MMYIKLKIFKVSDLKNQHQIMVWPPRGCPRLLIWPQRPLKIMWKVYYDVYQTMYRFLRVRISKINTK